MSARAGGFFSLCGTNLSSLKLGSRTVVADASGPCANNESRLDMRVPSDLTPGSYTMTMENAGGTWTGTQNFTVTSP
jgi:hypothetical protein